jgi:hypothetical protein
LLLFADPSWLAVFGSSSGAALTFRYPFESDVARGRYRALLRRLFQETSSRPASRSEKVQVDWQHFLNTETETMEQIERSVFALSRLIANLSRVDGAVVLNKQLDLVGFGAEVSGQLHCPDTVWQALDLEAERRLLERADAVGTRHRAAYRFVSAHAEGLAIVISQDGAVRVVANRDGAVVYWEQFLNW